MSEEEIKHDEPIYVKKLFLKGPHNESLSNTAKKIGAKNFMDFCNKSFSVIQWIVKRWVKSHRFFSFDPATKEFEELNFSYIFTNESVPADYDEWDSIIEEKPELD